MEDYPENLMEFEKRFSTEKGCRDYLFKLRWPNGFECPRCGHEKAWHLKKFLYQCSDCDHKVSVIAGTIFHGTHKSLVLWFRAIWWLTCQKNGASALSIQKIMGLGSYKTAWAWLHKLRRAMITPGRDNLSGIVEVDEIYIGGKQLGKRGRGSKGKSLGYNHKIIRQSLDVGDNLLPNCHLVASLLKRWLVGTHQGAVSHEHLEYYLDEFSFRFNRRTSTHRGKLFYRLLQNAVAIKPIPFNCIKKMSKSVY